jgi:hypothetical protein
MRKRFSSKNLAQSSDPRDLELGSGRNERGEKLNEVSIESMEAVSRYHNVKSVLYKTVDIFAGVTRRKLWIKDDDNGPSTDGHELRIPLLHEDAYSMLEEMLAHVLFRSSAKAKARFLREYSKKISEVARKSGVSLPVARLEKPLSSIITILEKHRVLSLWGRLYEGSIGFIRARHRVQAEEAGLVGDRAHESIVAFMYALWAMEGGVPGGRMDRFRPCIQEAMQKVTGRGFDATLMITKWLVVQLVNQIIEEAKRLPDGGSVEASTPAPSEEPAEERSKALENLVPQLEKESSPNPIEDQVSPTQYLTREEREAADQALERAMKLDVGDERSVADALGRSADEMASMVDKVLQEMRQQMTKGDWLQREALAKVVFENNKSKDLPLPLSLEDEQTVQRLRALFYRIIGRKKVALEDSGVEIDVQAYIERKLTNNQTPVFRQEGRGQGFRALILLDRSSSMQGKKTQQGQRACRIIRKALAFPFVEVSVWGFCSQEQGSITLIRYDEKKEICLANDGGMTPLHTAIRLGAREMKTGSEYKQLFVLTDGFPVYTRRDGKSFGTKQLLLFTHEEVRRARSRKINVTGVMIGGKEMTDKGMVFMFGSRRCWKRVREETLGKDLVGLVASSFVDYLRRR